MLKYDTVRNQDAEYVMPAYRRFPTLFVQGSGATLWDIRGKEFIDLTGSAGLVGHCAPSVVAAISRQAGQLIGAANSLLTTPPTQLSERLCKLAGMDRAFIADGDDAAVDTALKIAKKHGLQKRPDGDYEIVALHRSSHGGSLGGLSITGQRKLQRPFEPLLGGVTFVDANDLAALKDAVSHKTAAIVLEPVLSAGGGLALTTEFLKAARDLAAQHSALLVFDESATGVGRTGSWFAFQRAGVQPDVLVLANGLGGGLPIGVCLARASAAKLLCEEELNGSGASPLACAAALALVDTIEVQDLLPKSQKLGAAFADAVRAIGGPVSDVRANGMYVSVELNKPNAVEVADRCFENGLLVSPATDNSLLLMAPLNVRKDQLDKALAAFAAGLGVEKPKAALVAEAVEPRPTKLHDVLAVDDLTTEQIVDVLALAKELKYRRKNAPEVITPVEGRTVAMVFEKPSLRTRVTFETAIRELGGHPVHLGQQDIGMGHRESVHDVACNLDRWCNAIVARLFWQKDLVTMAEECHIPVVNALTEYEHPCQALADILTVQEIFGDQKVKITYVGDGNNVARSLAKVAVRLGYPFTICGPENFRLENIEGMVQTSDMEEGLADAHVIYTDVWVSMGDEHEQDHRMKVFAPYQVNARLMSMAPKDAIFLHCLPAHRGFEVTDEVVDSPQSRVFDQSENRLFAQKALLQRVLGG